MDVVFSWIAGPESNSGLIMFLVETFGESTEKTSSLYVQFCVEVDGIISIQVKLFCEVRSKIVCATMLTQINALNQAYLRQDKLNWVGISLHCSYSMKNITFSFPRKHPSIYIYMK